MQTIPALIDRSAKPSAGWRASIRSASSPFAALILVLAVSSASHGQTPALSVLYAFPSATAGNTPTASPLIQDTAGVLYGTAGSGGDLFCHCGAIYSVVPATGVETTVYAFPGGPSASGAAASVIRDSKGNLYGTSVSGGSQEYGSVFRVSPKGIGTVLHSFHAPAKPEDGYIPQAGLVGDAAGNLYGTTSMGGTSGFGTVFKIGPTGAYTVLYSFGTNPKDGIFPNSNLISDAAGNLYGTTSQGIVNEGTIFRLSPTGNETILHSFTGGPGDGLYPEESGLVGDGAGNLYGVTQHGGASDRGVVYKLSADGVFSLLYSFTGGPDGGLPIGKLFFLAGTGNLYGTASEGGIASGICASQNPGGCGVLFKVVPSTGKEEVLYSFTGMGDGFMPASGLIGRQGEGTSYELFGTTVMGGDVNCFSGFGCGTVFKLTITP